MIADYNDKSQGDSIMTFGQFILTRKAGKNPRGDFIRDARRDANFPQGAEDYMDLRNYIEAHGACVEAARACARIHQEYLRTASKEEQQNG